MRFIVGSRRDPTPPFADTFSLLKYARRVNRYRFYRFEEIIVDIFVVWNYPVVAYFQFWIEYSIIGSSSRRKRNCSIWDLCVIIISFFSVFSFELKLWIWIYMFLDRDIRRDFSIIFNNFVRGLASFKVS